MSKKPSPWGSQERDSAEDIFGRVSDMADDIEARIRGASSCSHPEDIQRFLVLAARRLLDTAGSMYLVKRLAENEKRLADAGGAVST